MQNACHKSRHVIAVDLDRITRLNFKSVLESCSG